MVLLVKAFLLQYKFYLERPLPNIDYMKHKLLCALFAMSTFTAFTQKNYWHLVSQASALRINKNKSLFSDAFQPAAYKVFLLDEAALLSALQQTTSVVLQSSSFLCLLPMELLSISGSLNQL